MTLDGAPARAPRWLRVLAIAALLFTIGNAVWAAWDQGLTYDESFHLEWARRLALERIDARDQVRFDSKTPALLAGALAAEAVKTLELGSERLLRFVSRLNAVAYLVGCAFFTFLIGRRWGNVTAWIALLLLALDPSMAANASIATSDVAYALAVLIFGWAILRDDTSIGGSVILGAALGASWATKFTALLLVPVCLAYLAFRPGRRPKARILDFVVTAASSCVVASACYLFVGVGTSLRAIPFQMPLFQRLAAAIPWAPTPFPRSILTGIDYSMEHDAHVGWNVYLFGTIHPDGVWYYFPAHWLIKTPLAVIAATAVGLWLSRMRRPDRTATCVMGLLLLHLAYFSLSFGTQIGYRFVLQSIPLAALLVAYGLTARGMPAKPWILALTLFSLAERVPYWGDPIAFTNALVWPKSRAYFFTADSSIDYGQNRERLGRYARESGLALVQDQSVVTPGWYVVMLNELTKLGNFRSNMWLAQHDVPAVRLGFTHFAFAMTGERYESYMDEARMLPPAPDFAATCAGDSEHLGPGDKMPLIQTTHPDGGRLWIVCASSRKGSDIGLLVAEGRALFGPVIGRECFPDMLSAGQTAWWRIPPGGRARLCIQEIPFKRAWLPYKLDSRILVRNRGMDLGLQSIAPGSLDVRYGYDQLAR